MEMFGLVKKAVLAGLGIGSMGCGKFEELVRQGEESQSEYAKAIKRLMAEAEKDSQKLEEKGRKLAEKCLEKVPIPTRTDFERLEKKIQDLSSRIGKSGKA